jgi:hypothetical protein
MALNIAGVLKIETGKNFEIAAYSIGGSGSLSTIPSSARRCKTREIYG